MQLRDKEESLYDMLFVCSETVPYQFIFCDSCYFKNIDTNATGNFKCSLYKKFIRTLPRQGNFCNYLKYYAEEQLKLRRLKEILNERENKC